MKGPLRGLAGCRISLGPQLRGETRRQLEERTDNGDYDKPIRPSRSPRSSTKGPFIPTIALPLVSTVEELARQRKLIEETAEEVFRTQGKRIEFSIGTMIETPRAALTADDVAEQADFFSFGTNDLTQMTFGFSRDDAGRFLPRYVESDLLPADPFQTLDTAGVGQLVRMAAHLGRSTKEGLKLGICGEHGGDPASVAFCHEIGLDYVSCSPFRVPVARLAAAQAALEGC